MTTSTELPPTNNYMAEKMAEAEDPMRSIALEVDTRRRKILEDLAEIGADVEQTYQAVAIDEDALDGGINTHGDEYSVDVSYDIKTRPWRQQILYTVGARVPTKLNGTASRGDKVIGYLSTEFTEYFESKITAGPEDVPLKEIYSDPDRKIKFIIDYEYPNKDGDYVNDINEYTKNISDPEGKKIHVEKRYASTRNVPNDNGESIEEKGYTTEIEIYDKNGYLIGIKRKTEYGEKEKEENTYFRLDEQGRWIDKIIVNDDEISHFSVERNVQGKIMNANNTDYKQNETGEVLIKTANYEFTDSGVDDDLETWDDDCLSADIVEFDGSKQIIKRQYQQKENKQVVISESDVYERDGEIFKYENTYEYDDAGNMTKVNQDINGTKYTIEYEYNPEKRITRVIEKNSEGKIVQETVNHSWDKDGKVITTETKRFDDAGNLIK